MLNQNNLKGKAKIYADYGIEYKNGKIKAPVFGWINPLLVDGNEKIGKGVYHFSTLPTNRGLTDYIRILRGHKDGKPIVWRGVGIDPTARACKCWIEDLETVNRFRKSVGASPIA